jgi:hypothetical protein
MAGGIIVFDDMWMQSVSTVVDFVIRNRAYEWVPQPVENMAVLQKRRDDDRDWQHFVPFNVALRKRPLLHRIGSKIRLAFR